LTGVDQQDTVTVIDESEVLQMTSTTPAPSLLDAAFVLATTHQADLRRQAAHHGAARRARAALLASAAGSARTDGGRRSVRALALSARTALTRRVPLRGAAPTARVGAPCPTC
jgi:hypothetical protein